MWATTATCAPDARPRPRTCMVPPGRLACPRGGSCRQGRGAARRGHASHTHRDPSRPQAPWVLGVSLASAQLFSCFCATRRHPPTQASSEKSYTPTELFLWLGWVGGGSNDGVNVMPYEATRPSLSLFLSSVKARKGLWTTPLDSDQGRRARRHATCLAARISTHEVLAVDYDDVRSLLGDPTTEGAQTPPTTSHNSHVA